MIDTIQAFLQSVPAWVQTLVFFVAIVGGGLWIQHGNRMIALGIVMDQLEADELAPKVTQLRMEQGAGGQGQSYD